MSDGEAAGEHFVLDRREHDDLTNRAVELMQSRGVADAATFAAVGLSLVAWALRLAARDQGVLPADILRQRCVRAVNYIDASPLPEDV